MDNSTAQQLIIDSFYDVFYEKAIVGTKELAEALLLPPDQQNKRGIEQRIAKFNLPVSHSGHNAWTLDIQPG